MVASGASAILTASEVGALPFHPVICQLDPSVDVVLPAAHATTRRGAQPPL